MGKCVALYHPGGPVRYRDVRGWTTRRHGRKFLQVSGEATHCPDTRPVNQRELFFWGEYEAPTTQRPLNVPNGHSMGLPHSVDTILHPVPAPSRFCGNLNTDPFVFCGPFLYTNCQQLGPNNTPRKTQSLRKGDLILFGSHLGGCFVLDTCLVVSVGTALASYQKQIKSGSVFDLVTNRLIHGLPVTVFEGATWSENNPFSFVPCWNSLNGGQGHPRPVLVPKGALSGVITPKKTQGIKGLHINHLTVQPIFNEVVKQVLSQGCLLGTYIDHPQCGTSSGTHAQDKAHGQPSRRGRVC